MAKTIRTRYFLQTNGTTENNSYKKQIYIKNAAWNPPPAPLHIEDKITEFEKSLKVLHSQLISKHKYKKRTNLTPLQVKTLKELKTNKGITIKPTDKNLGPAILDTSQYISQVLKEHLLTPAYKQLSQLEVTRAIENLKTTLKNLIQTNTQLLSKSELTSFERSLRLYHRLPIFYGLPKVHKEPFSLRPVVSTSGSLLAIFSTWLDYKMKDLVPLVKSYVKNSFMVIEELKNMTIPANALLFSADAVSMYTNIETSAGLNAISNFIQTIEGLINGYSLSPLEIDFAVTAAVVRLIRSSSQSRRRRHSYAHPITLSKSRESSLPCTIPPWPFSSPPALNAY